RQGVKDRALRDGQRSDSEIGGAEARLRDRARVRPHRRSRQDGQTLCRRGHRASRDRHAGKLTGADAMIRCVKLWTGADAKSHFEEGFVELEPGARGDALSTKLRISSASFHETDVDPKLGWHPDVVRQLVISLSGTLQFETHGGVFTLHPGDVLF